MKDLRRSPDRYIQHAIDHNQVVLFSTRQCQPCDDAKVLLQTMNVKFLEFDIFQNQESYRAYMNVTGHKSFPCIFVNKDKLGGKPELVSAVADGKLQKKLKIA